MGKATFIGESISPMGAVQRHYRLTPPMQHERWDDTIDVVEHVVVSALGSALDTGAPETYIFPADETGEIVDFGEIGASQRGTTDHEKVLRESGYTV